MAGIKPQIIQPVA